MGIFDEENNGLALDNDYSLQEIAYHEEQDKRQEELESKKGNFHEFVLAKQEGMIDKDTVYLTVGRDFIEDSGYDLMHFDNIAEEQGIYGLDEIEDGFRGAIFEGKKGHYYLVAEKDRAQFVPKLDPKEQALEAKRIEQEAKNQEKEKIAFLTANIDDIKDIQLSTGNFIKAAEVFEGEQTAHFLGNNQGVMTHDKRIRALNQAADTMLIAIYGYERTQSLTILNHGSKEGDRAFFAEQFSEMQGFLFQMEQGRKMASFSNTPRNLVFKRPEGFVPSENPKLEPAKPESRKGVFRRALSVFTRG